MNPTIVITGLVISALFLAIGGYKLAKLLVLMKHCSHQVQGYMTESAHLKGDPDTDTYVFDVVYTVKGVGYKITTSDDVSPGNRGRKFKVRYDPDEPSNAYLPEVESFFVPIILILVGLIWPLVLLFIS